MSYQGPSTFGLIASHNIAAANGVDPYKPAKFLDDNQWWGNKAQAPVNTQWTAPSYQNFNYQKYDSGGSDPSYKTYGPSAPQYKGFDGGDYDRYELSVRNPGEQAAQRAYDSAKRDLADAYSSRGMYGSSQYTRQMDTQVNRSYMDALSNNAANAATQRYNFQAQDQQYAQQQAMAEWQARMQENSAANQMDYNAWANRLAENEQMNNMLYQDNAADNAWNWQASTAQRDWNDSQAMRQVNYDNMLAQNRQDWDMQRLQWDTQQNDAAWNRTYGIWSHVDPETEHYEKKLLKQQATAADNKSSGTGGLISSIGGTVGGALSMIPTPWTQAIGGVLSIGSKMAGGIVDASERGDTGSIFRSIGGSMPGMMNSFSSLGSLFGK
ncbi:hypothetical protein [Fundidesulfovibrio terrae]|uniref:hypothetical protein n=1 Tax=Fundidesulfovibrio terrae TaxID=2922866 RepID=UPI001FAE845E|nr:hypothetical protein [Fundidesulfovibrio terrae]